MIIDQSVIYLIIHLLEDIALLISQNIEFYSAGSLHVQEASTAKLFVTPTHGSPNVSLETPMLQLFDPIQACKFFTCKSTNIFIESNINILNRSA